jgi:glutamine cyclotransferase
MKRLGVPIAAVVVALAALVFGGWWLFVRDTTVPREGACDPATPEALDLEVVAEYPHDPEAYTQGLLFVGDDLWESTGIRGESDLRRVDLDTGAVLAEVPLAPELFGEGLALGGDGELVQLTWTSGEAIRWDIGGDEPVESGSFDYDGEGWGLTKVDSGDFVMSDGSDTLSVRSTEDFEMSSVFTVDRADGPADQLNELEWDGEELWANRYRTDEILRIDLACGVVDGVVDASELTRRAAELSAADGFVRDFTTDDVINGIAEREGRLFLTGKRWPVLFEVTVSAG